MMNAIVNDIDKEKTIWKGTPSQWINFTFYVLCIPLILVFGLGILLALWKYLDTKYNKLEITTQRVIEYKGILSRTTNELELYRVKDLRHEQPFFLRIIGLSDIVLDTTDHSNMVLKIRGVESGKELKEELRKAVDIRRDIKGVRELDI